MAALVLLIVVVGLSAFIYHYYFSPQAQLPDIHPLQLAQQSSISKVRESTHESAVYRSKLAPQGTNLLSSPSSELETLRDALRSGRQHGTEAMQYAVNEDISKLTFDEVTCCIQSFAGNLQRTAEWTDESAKSVAIAVPASPEFLVAYQACVEYGMVAIPMYVDDTATNMAKILKHSKTTVLVASASVAMKLGEHLSSTSVTHVIIVGELDGSEAADAVKAAAHVSVFSELETGAGPDQDAEISPSDTAYVLYSANGGRAQGVVVTHKNALAAVAGLMSAIPADKALSSRDAFMSTTSMADATNLAHINTALLVGCPIHIVETSDAEEFAAWAQQLAPTFTYIMPSLARDLRQLFHTHVEKYPSLEGKLFARAYRSAVETLMRGQTPKVSFGDFAYFRHYRNFLGGKLRLMFVSGHVPSKHIEWFRVLHGAKVIPVFGTPQTAGIATAALYYDYASAIDTHNVGAPVACNELKLVDINELTAEDKPYPRGCITVRGNNVSASLWNDSSAKPTDDGWLMLAECGMMLPNGTLEILGASENIVEGTNGLVYLEVLERSLLASSAVTDLCIVANAKAKKFTAVAHPRPMELYRAAHKKRKSYKMKQIDQYPWCAEYIRETLLASAVSAGVDPEAFEVKLVPEPFSVKNGLLLADGSVDRVAVKKVLDEQ